uniref:non-specific serine/threonine protein kinase n=1 Tax=Triticum urartu TaxID=4572 RepID=A0A8R7QXX1_TRIUA
MGQLPSICCRVQMARLICQSQSHRTRVTRQPTANRTLFAIVGQDANALQAAAPIQTVTLVSYHLVSQKRCFSWLNWTVELDISVLASPHLCLRQTSQVARILAWEIAHASPCSSTKKQAIASFLTRLVACSRKVQVKLIFHLSSRRKRYPPSSQDEAGSSEDDGYLQTISGAPVRFTYRELQDATNNFSNKLGQGGFGSVYLGTLPDGSRIAVKKLEGIGQGRKEFRSEVTIIGSIHHIHLVKLRGFCAEDSHRLLAYEYMAKGSLERWIFRTKEDDPLLDWDTRFNIALGAAKGLAYLHQDCESKIIHCDIKPENFLLDDNFLVKVSDFGLAKLMSREQSHVFTTMRGTRGYLAPEWITNYAISEKSDVYSYGMVLLEIISGRKNFDPVEGSEKAHFPSFAFKKLEEGDLREILDSKLRYNDKDERLEIAIKVALWCIQEDFYQRPSMSKVVQMLECVCDVPQPPMSSQIGYRLYANALKSSSEEGMSSGMSDYNSEALLSAVRLSGPR